LPPQTDESGEETPMSPEVEARLSPLLAQAAQRLLQQNQQQAQQQMAQQQAQDPLTQMAQQELQLKAGELQRKQQKDQADAALKAAQLEVEKQRIATQAEIENKRITTQIETDDKRTRMDLMKTAATMSNARETKVGETVVDVLKHLSNKNAEEQLRAMQERLQARKRQPENRGE
jgi:hypothetical protein